MKLSVFSYLLVMALNQAVAEDTIDKHIVIATHTSTPSPSSIASISNNNVDPVLTCIFDKMGYSFEVYNLPWARAKKELERGSVDAIFFTASNEILPGINTNPIYLDRWMAYGINKNSFHLEGKSVGTLRGSNLSNWLATQNTANQMKATSVEQLIGLLSAGRFDYFVANYEQIEAQDTGITDVENLNRFFIKYQATGVTFSLQAVDKWADVKDQFDNQITLCNPSITQLNHAEKSEVTSFMHYVVMSKVLAKVFPLKGDFSEKVSGLSPEEVMRRDDEWKEAFIAKRLTGLMQNVLNNELSLALQEIHSNTPNIVELFITDKNGVLLGASEITSDYYQGDENKIIELNSTDFYISDVHFDESTRHFQVHFSMRIPNSAGLILVAGLTLEDLIIHSSQNEMQSD